MECRLCASRTLTEFLDLGQQPLANKYPAKNEIASEQRYRLNVFFCTTCRNVQLGTVVSRDVMFKDYFYLSSVNGALVKHFEALARSLSDARLVIDVGSNDGILLRPLKDLGVRAIGVEPSINVSKIANDHGLETICSFFDTECARQIERDHGKPDVIVASSVFTHLENPHDFIDAARALLSDDGRLIIEVEYIGNIIRSIQFERFYLDRIFYYSLSSLDRLFAAHDMAITDVEHIEPHGGSLRVTARQKGHARDQSVDRLLKEEMEFLTETSLASFRKQVDLHVSALRDRLAEFRNSSLKVAGYGAPARLSTICNYGQIGPSLIGFTVEDNPLKQGKLTPGTHIPIVTREHLDVHRPDILVVFAYEYLDDIRAKTGNRYRYLIPIPPREVS